MSERGRRRRPRRWTGLLIGLSHALQPTLVGRAVLCAPSPALAVHPTVLAVVLIGGALAGGLVGCATPSRGKPSVSAAVSSGAGLDELHLVTMPVAIDLDGKPGVDGVAVKVYAVDRRLSKTQSIRAGTLDALMFDGVVAAPFPGTNAVRHQWSFPADALAPYGFTTAVGVGYNLTLNWGEDSPHSANITVVARCQPTQGLPIYSAPSYVAIGPR